MAEESTPAPGGVPATGIPIVNYRSLVPEGENEPSLFDLERLEQASDGAEDRLREVFARGDKLVSGAATEVERVPLTAVLPRIESLLREETRNPDVLVAPRDKWTARFQSIVASSALEAGADAFLEGGVVKFSSQHDYLDWARAFVEAWFEREWRTHAFVRPQDPDLVNRPELQLALFSDWGTGMYGAPRIKAAIEAMGDFDYIVHLGDTYYTGEPHGSNEHYSVIGQRFRARSIAPSTGTMRCTRAGTPTSTPPFPGSISTRACSRSRTTAG